MCAVKGKGKGGFKGTWFKCGMRRHKADRCWQRGKGKGSQGDWEKGKKWIQRVRMVRKKMVQILVTRGDGSLCEVSLSSSCEKFSEAKRMTRGTHTQTSQPGSPKNFAHVNRFSKFLCMTTTSSLVKVVLHCTRQGLSVNNGNAVTNELMSAIQVLSKKKFHQGSGTLNLNAHHVSYLASSCGDSRGVHHVSGDGWRRLSAILPLGAQPQKRIVKSVLMMETEASRQGQMYHSADGGAIKNKGEKTVTMYSETGDQYRARYQITDVTRPLNSVSRVCDQKNNVLFTQTGWIFNHATGRYTWFPREHAVFVLHSGIIKLQPENVHDGQMSLIQGRSARFQRFRRTRGTSGLWKTL